jgi:hypothetical protein
MTRLTDNGASGIITKGDEYDYKIFDHAEPFPSSIGIYAIMLDKAAKNYHSYA